MMISSLLPHSARTLTHILMYSCGCMVILLSIISQIKLYAEYNNFQEQDDQLQEIISSFPQLPPQLDFFAITYPFG